MARPERNNVDYFPHPVVHGKKMFYLRSKYKNDGYAIWFMLLEQLGKADFHYLDLANEVQLMYLSSEFMMPENIIIEVINTLTKFDEFDSDLWKEKILFSQKFVDSIKDAYERRNNNVVQKQALCTTLIEKGRLKTTFMQKKNDSKPQRIVKDTKEEESKVNIIPELFEFKKYVLDNDSTIEPKRIELKYKSWVENGWKDGNNKKIINWKSKVLNVIPYMKNGSEVKQQKIETDAGAVYPRR